MHFLKYLLPVVLVFFAISCNKSDEEESYGIRITPEENYLSRKGGNVVNFTINAASSREFTRYRITEEINNVSTITLRDKAISGKVYTDWFDYTVPDTFGFGNNQIELIFSTFDVRGNEMKRAKIINVTITEKPLTEYGGNTIYSSISNQFDAFDLLTGTPKYSSDSTSHIRDLTRANPSDSLSKSWTSPAPEINFVRFNSFDYGNATNQTVRTAYETGIKNDTIRNLKADDILLTKINDKYLAVKLIFVTDLNGIVNDKYIFSIKR